MSQKKSIDSVLGAWGLIVAAWLASIIPLPFFLYGLAGYAMPGHVRATVAEAAMLGASPMAGLVALLGAFFWCQRSRRRLVGMVVPLLLVLGELAFTLLVWVGK